MLASSLRVYDMKTRKNEPQRPHTVTHHHLELPAKGSFTNYVDKILAFFDHPPPCVDIFYGMNDDKKWTFLDHLLT